jgi:hypothetical protein
MVEGEALWTLGCHNRFLIDGASDEELVLLLQSFDGWRLHSSTNE